MPLDQDARRYAETLFTDKLEQSSREHQAQVVATTNKLSSRGMLASGMYYSELARLGVEHVKNIAHGRVDSMFAAYDRSKLPVEDEAGKEILAEATEWCERQGANVAKNVQDKATFAGMGENLGHAIGATVERQISAIQGEIRRKVERKILEAKFDGRRSTPTTAEPEPTDDLLPTLPRRRFDTDLVEVTASASPAAPIALVMIDIDNFKSVNDKFGHEAGDEVLKGIATTIKSVCHSKGRCYRYGGDELAVLLPNYTTTEARALADRIADSIARTTFKRFPNPMTLSIGVASYPGSCGKREQLLECADRAMYNSKNGGKNRVSLAAPEAYDSASS